MSGSQGANFFGTKLADIKWNKQTVWPTRSKVDKANSIPDNLKEQLGMNSPGQTQLKIDRSYAVEEEDKCDRDA